ncbi:MAG: Na/Pi cotransporter family protein [Kiloniellaceae bacterium]
MSGHALLLHIAGGVALLLWATRMVRTGIMRAYGAELRRILGRSTRSRLSACLMGVATAGVLQSATATALLAVSFAGRGLVEIAPALALMLGADVGSTLVVQVLSFDVSGLSPVLILAGVISFLAGPSAQWRHVGRVFIGLGLMLLALTLVVGASEPLRESMALQYVLRPLANDPILAVLLAAVITWVAHSSVAIVLLVMSLTAVGVVPVGLGFALVLGANVGSGIIPVALTVSSPARARRIPLGNLLVRAAGAVVALPFIGLLVPYIELLGSDPARQIANFHTAFNVALAAAFLPFVTLLGQAMAKVLPDTGEVGGAVTPKYLDPEAIGTPSVAIACATREVLRMADTVETMLRGAQQVLRTDDAKLLQTLSKLDDEIDELHESVKLYLTKVTRHELSDEDSRRCIDLIAFTTNLEHIGDIIDKNLLDIAQKKIRKRLAFSEPGWQELTALHERVMRQMQLAMGVFVSGDAATARQLIKEKERFRELELQAGQKHLDRLRSGRIESIETSALHLDILRDLKRINSHLTALAYPILDASGQLRRSRLVGQPEPEAEPEPAPEVKPGQADSATFGR